jgi:hypothetical protein
MSNSNVARPSLGSNSMEYSSSWDEILYGERERDE